MIVLCEFKTINNKYKQKYFSPVFGLHYVGVLKYVENFLIDLIWRKINSSVELGSLQPSPL